MKSIKKYEKKFAKNITKLISGIVLLEDWFEIRNDFLELYENGLKSNKMQKRITNKNSIFWYSNALKIRESAKGYHPYKYTKDFYDDILQNVNFIGDLFSLLLHFFSVAIIVGIIGIIAFISNPIISFIIAFITLLIWCFKLLLQLFIFIINTEEELIENIINHLMLSENDLTSKKHNLHEMIAGFIWNRSLLYNGTNKNIPILEFFIIIKHFSNRFYQSIMYGLSTYLPEYLDNGRSIKSLMKVAPNIFRFWTTKEK